MDLDHPPDELLARFLRCGTTNEENQLVVRHLLTRCPACAARLQHLEPKPAPAIAYDEALERFVAKARRWRAGTEKRIPCSPRQPNLLSQL
jgi:hypothetical protein